MAVEQNERKQVLVQLDVKLLTRLDAEATEMGVNRSEAIRRAVGEFLRERRNERADRQAAEAYRLMPETEDERLERDAAMRAAAEIDLPYDE